MAMQVTRFAFFNEDNDCSVLPKMAMTPPLTRPRFVGSSSSEAKDDIVVDPHSKLIPLHLHPLGFIEAFTHLGADLDALLRDTGIHARMLESKNMKISYEQQKTLLRNGVELCKQPGLGLLVGQRFDWSYHGTVGSVVQCSPSLKDAAEAFQRYSRIAQPLYAMGPRQPNTYVDEKGMLIHKLEYLSVYGEGEGPFLQFAMEFRLAVVLRIWDMCGNKSVPDPSVHVCLDYPEPPHAELYRALPCTSSWSNASRSCAMRRSKPATRTRFAGTSILTSTGRSRWSKWPKRCTLRRVR